jgi:hypothetical protein
LTNGGGSGSELTESKLRTHRKLSYRVIPGKGGLTNGKQKPHGKLADWNNTDGELADRDYPEGHATDGQDAHRFSHPSRLRISAKDNVNQGKAEKGCPAPVLVTRPDA